MRKLIELFNLESLEPAITNGIQTALKIIVYGVLAFVTLVLANWMLEPIIPQLQILSGYAIEIMRTGCVICACGLFLIVVYNVIKYY